MRLDVTFTPADFEGLGRRDLARSACVVFDVLRATSSMITALEHGAERILPVGDIPEALVQRAKHPQVLLAGERHGLRITRELTGSLDFDLGNSPREFLPEIVTGRTIVMTTTNGTRALRACAASPAVLASAFLNLGATARFVSNLQPEELILVCSGTFEEAAYEDTLAAGALCDLVWPEGQGEVSDSALMARALYLEARADIPAALGRARNGRRLLSQPALRDDVAFCARRDSSRLVARMDDAGFLTRG